MTTYYLTDYTTDETVSVPEEQLLETVALFRSKLRQKCVEYFPIVKIEQVGTDTTWSRVFDLSETAEGVYSVFNYYSGTHETEGTAAETLSKRAALIERYVEEAYEVPYTVVTKVEVLP